MKSTVGIYNTWENGIKAVHELVANGIPSKHISLVGKTKKSNKDSKQVNVKAIEMTSAFFVMGGGAIVGLLSGLGLFSIPGFEFLNGTGAISGLFGGLGLGLIAGVIVVVLEILILNEKKQIDSEQPRKKKRFSLVVNGESEEVDKAERILHTEGFHLMFQS